MTVASRLLPTEPSYTTGYLGTGLNSLANNSFQVGASIDNSGRNSLVRVKLNMASWTPTAGGTVDIYIIPGEITDYNEGDNTNMAQDTWLAFRFRLRAAASTQKLITPLLNAERYFKIGLVNRSGAAFAASGNTVDYRLAAGTMETP